jgi:hypothetical protein
LAKHCPCTDKAKQAVFAAPIPKIRGYRGPYRRQRAVEGKVAVERIKKLN